MTSAAASRSGLLPALLLTLPVLAVAGPVPQAYELDVTIHPDAHALEGRADIYFDSDATADTLVFYLHGELGVDSLALAGRTVAVASRPVFYTHNYSLIARRVEIPVTASELAGGLTVWYSGTFHRSRARSPSDYMCIDADGALLRSYGYSLWFPIFLAAGEDSHPADFRRVDINIPEAFQAVFAGELETCSPDGGVTRCRWRAEGLDVFGAQLTARRFVTRRDAGCTAWVLDDPVSLAAADRILDLARRLDAFYRDHYRATGSATQLHVMQMPRFGDIASANVIGLSPDAWQDFDPAGYDGSTLAHELVHDRVRMQVSRSDPLFVLAREGFPSYFHLPALDAVLKDGQYAERIRRIEARYRARRATGTDGRGRSLPPEKPILAITADEIGIYKDRFVLPDRVVLFFDAIRSRLGPDAFDVFTRDLFAREQLDRQGFEAIVLEHLPDFGAELREWLETTRYPVARAGPGGKGRTLKARAPVLTTAASRRWSPSWSRKQIRFLTSASSTIPLQRLGTADRVSLVLEIAQAL